MLLIIASYRNGCYILALPGKVQRFGSYQVAGRVIGAFILPSGFSLHCTFFADSFYIRYPSLAHVHRRFSIRDVSAPPT